MSQKKIPSALRNVRQETVDQIHHLIGRKKMDEAVSLYSKESGLTLEEAKTHVDEEKIILDQVWQSNRDRVQKESLSSLQGKTSAIVLGVDEQGQGSCFIFADEENIFRLMKMLLIQDGKVGVLLRQAAGAGLAESIAMRKMKKVPVNEN